MPENTAFDAGRTGEIRIESAQDADAEALLALQRRAYASEARLYDETGASRH